MAELLAEELQKDAKLAEGMRLILDSVEEKKLRLKGVKAADPSKKESYQNSLDAFSSVRGGKLWYPYIGSGIGNGCLVELMDGSVKYDMACGIGVHYLGHNHPKLMEAGLRASYQDTIMQGHLQQNIESYKLCQTLCNASKFDHCFLSSSGVMANENALKIAFHYRQPASRVLTFKSAFAGRTLAVSQISDKPAFRLGLPQTLQVDYIPFYDANRPEESTKEAIAALQEHVQRYPNQHAAFMAELVQGEGGIYPGSKEFFQKVFDCLHEHGILVIADEVQSFGRTPKLFAFQYFELEQHVDIVTIGKLSQVCATLFNKELTPKPGLLSQTYTSSTAAIMASQAILDELIQGNYYGPKGRVQEVHHRFVERLEAIRQRHPGSVFGPYGIGAMFAFTPWDGEFSRVSAFTQYLFEKGVISFIAGARPARVRFLIPVGAIADADIDSVCDILEDALVSFPNGIVPAQQKG